MTVADSVASLPNPGPLTAAQKKLLKSTAPVLEQHGEAITRHFYKEMLEQNPSLRNIFSHSKQQKGDQAKALAGAVYAYAAHIDDLTPILPVVERLCNKHASLHIIPEQYAIVGKHLLEAITAVLGADVFSGELYDAWYAGYWQLAHICINREAQLYSRAAWVGWKEFTVQKKVEETAEITSFYLVPKDGTSLPKYLPGQYISVQKFIDELGFYQSRQYSLSDSPHPEYFRISVKRERGIYATDPNTGAVDTTHISHPGWISNLLHDKLNVGDSVDVAYPFGDFFLDDTTSPIVLISAGVGVTPLNSMVHTLVESSSTRPISWVQVVRNRSAHPWKDEIQNLQKAHPSTIRTLVFYSNPDESSVAGRDYDVGGRFELGKVDNEALYLSDPKTQYYVCGPEKFMADVTSGLKAKGVEIGRIHAEVFGAGAVPQ